MSLLRWVTRKRKITEDEEANNVNDNSTSVSVGQEDIYKENEKTAIAVGQEKDKNDVSFKKNYDDFKDWLVKKDGEKICKFCNSTLNGYYAHFKRHAETETHIKNVESCKSKFSIESCLVAEDKRSLEMKYKELETKLCLFVAEHNLPFKCLDHLNKLLKTTISDSKIVKGINIHRCKAQKILKNIIGPENVKSISQLTQKEYYSLIIDESTDLTCSKNIAIVIRVFNKRSCDRFLDLVPVTNSTSQGIFDAVKQCLDSHHIPFENMLSFAADNCSVMMGQYAGVQAKIKDLLPNLFVQGCVCHILNIATKTAFSHIPSVIERLLKEINYYFCHSSSRKKEFIEFQEYFGTEIHVILRHCDTRWLSRGLVICRILEQWEPLLYYFRIENFENDYKKTATFIEESLADINVKLYFIFLKYVLKLIDDINIEMQSEDYKMHIFIQRMTYLFKHLCRNFMKKQYLEKTSINQIELNEEKYHLKLSEVYGGTEFDVYLLKHKADIAETNKQEILSVIKKFYIRFCEILRGKINFDSEILNFFPNFSPVHVLEGCTNSITEFVFKLFPEQEHKNIAKINDEYRALADHEELQKFKKLSISEFWEEIGNIKNQLHQPVFSNIYKIAKGVLSIPHSSATVERIFSHQQLIKTKCRNRLAVDTVSALIKSKDFLHASASCCYSCKLNSDILNQNINLKEKEEIVLE